MAVPSIDHLYIHVPFCDVKCTFCALYSTVAEGEVVDRYIDAVLAELAMAIAAAGGRLRPLTVYIGGGTPTQLTEPQMVRFLGGLTASLDLSGLAEWTVECSPSSLTDGKLKTMRDVGVNRLSLGAQTFSDVALQRLRRLHTGGDVGHWFGRLREAGFTNAGVDLIACLPGIDEVQWGDDLRRAIELAPEHISVYGLGLEEGTALWKAVQRGRLAMAEEEVYLERLAVAESILGAAGYGRYEISNYARPGFACDHNLAYWMGRDFLGIGPAAGSRVGRERRRNAKDLRGYLERLGRGELPLAESETLSAADDVSERLMFAIRTDRGVALPAVAAGTLEAGLFARWRAELESLQAEGLVRREGDRWWLTDRGRGVADSICGVFLAEEEEGPQ